MKVPHPIRLNKTPIIETVLELRFSSKFPDSAIGGTIYGALREEYQEMIPQNAAEIPESIRAQSPELLLAAHYKLLGSGKNVEVLIGPKVLTVVYNRFRNGDYPGWSDYIYKELVNVIDLVMKTGVIEKFSRLGIRTWDLFEDDNIYDYSEMKLTVNQNDLHSKPLQITWVEKENSFANRITVNNSIVMQDPEAGTLQGSVIDIDTYMEELPVDFISNISTYITDCHNLNKKIFFDILDREYIKKYDPEYEKGVNSDEL